MSNNHDSDKTNNIESLLNAILDATPDLIFAKDNNLNYIVHNKAFARLVCPSGATLVGRSDQEIFSNQESIKRIRKIDQHILETGSTVHNQETTVSPQGKTAIVDTLKAPFYNDAGEILGLIGISRDVTKRVNTEEALGIAKEKAEAANIAKSEFLAKMSHEIRTPMNAIIGLSQLLQTSHLDTVQRDQVNKILNSAEVLLSQINDILDLSKIEKDKLSLEISPFSLTNVIERTITLCELKAVEKRLEFAVDIPNDFPNILMGDANRLQQVLVNLANNAIKFTEQGHVLIKVTIRSKVESTIYVDFSVEDTGIGISEDEQERLFVAFEQIDNSLTRNYEGSGLGLVICKQIIEMMGSEILVESHKGQGTIFSFTVAFDVLDSSASTKQVESLSGLKVLVVDDSSVARNIACDLLKHHGVSVESASNGKEAISMVTQAVKDNQDFDLILMDWRLPDVNGIEASRLIKQQVGKGHIPTILLLSAYDLSVAKQQIHASNIDAYLEKPISPKSMLDAIEQSLTVSHSESSLETFQQNVDTKPIVSTDAWGDSQFDFVNSRILVVDDNSINRQVVRGFLAGENLLIDEASSGQQAIEMLSERSYSLVLMDIQMPNLDGYSCSQIIREELGLTSLPIIAMTAHAMEEDKQRSIEAGMNAHMAKPIDSMGLKKMLVEYINGTQIASSYKGSASTDKLAESQYATVLVELNQISYLDTSLARQRCLNDDDLYCKLIEDFLADNRGCVQELNKALAEKNNSVVLSRTHSLKSGLAYIGAFELSEQCAEVETIVYNAKTENPTLLFEQKASRLISHLDVLFDHLDKALFHKLPTTDVLSGSLYASLLDLLPLLECSDFAAEIHLDKLVNIAKDSLYIFDINKIAERVNAVEFEQAYERCLALINRIRKG